MAVDVAEQAEGRARGAVWTWLCWLGGLLLVYVLSLGPVLRWWSNGRFRGRTATDTVALVYYPVAFAYVSTPLHKPLGLYFHFWAPKVYDRSGEVILNP